MSAADQELARTIAREYANQTHQNIELFVNHTTKSIDGMSESIKVMAAAVEESNKQIVRYEERQLATVARMERLEVGLKDQGKRFTLLRDEVKQNSTARKIGTWVSVAVVLAMLSGGMLFGSITGKTPQNGYNQTLPKSAT